MRGLSGEKCLKFRYAAWLDGTQDAACRAQHRSSRITERATEKF